MGNLVWVDPPNTSFPHGEILQGSQCGYDAKMAAKDELLFLDIFVNDCVTNLTDLSPVTYLTMLDKAEATTLVLWRFAKPVSPGLTANAVVDEVRICTYRQLFLPGR